MFLLSGTIIGVGMFGIPFVFSRAGFFVGLAELAVLLVVITIIHLMYGEILLRTETIHRLPGYVKRYLGARAKVFSTVSYVVGLSGSLLAYVVIGGQFLGGIFDTNPFLGSFLFWAAGGIFIFFSIRQSGAFDTVLNAALIGFILFFALKTLPFARWEYLSMEGSGDFFLPYGVLLFSLAGATAVPEIRALAGKNSGHLLKPIIIFGTALPAILYAFFAVSVVGISGPATSQDALSGLGGLISPSLFLLGEIIGVLAVFTSFIIIGLTLKETYHFDWGMGHREAWALASLPPFLLFVFGVNQFIGIIGFVGAITGGIDAVLTAFIFLKAKKFGLRTPEFSLAIPPAVVFGVIALFIFGIAGEFALLFL